MLAKLKIPKANSSTATKSGATMSFLEMLMSL
jgi:hypothetical protein